MYNEFFGTIVPDKSVNIGDYSWTLKKLMIANELTYDNFLEVSKKEYVMLLNRSSH